jgi:hypothetical protein
MDNPKQYTGKIKNSIRKIATKNRGKCYKRMVLMPSELALDARQAFETGIIDPDTTGILAIENVPKRRDGMIRRLRKITPNFLVSKSVESLNLDKFFPDNQVDYFFLDLCGNMSMKRIATLYRNQDSFADGMRFPITLAVFDRKMKGFVTDIVGEKRVKKVKKDAIYKAEKTVAPFCNITSEVESHIANQIFLLIHSMPSKRVEITKQYVYRNTDKSNMASYMVFLDIILHDCEEDVRKRNLLDEIIHKYNVHHSGNVFLRNKPKKSKKVKTIDIFSNAYDIGRHMGILDKKNRPLKKVSSLPRGKKSWIAINANKSGLDADKVNAKLLKKCG